MNRPGDVLLACPLYPGELAIFPDARRSIEALAAHSGQQVVLLRPRTPQSSVYRDITANYNEARRMLLNGRFEAMLTVEADMIVPADALTMLHAANADVAYALYVWRKQRLWNAYTKVDLEDAASLSAEPENARRSWGSVIEVEGVGLGCTLIRRHVLEAVEFRLRSDSPDKSCCDWLFSVDCRDRGFSQRAHLGVVCGHIIHERPGSALWPAPARTGLCEIREVTSDSADASLDVGQMGGAGSEPQSRLEDEAHSRGCLSQVIEQVVKDHTFPWSERRLAARSLLGLELEALSRGMGQ